MPEDEGRLDAGAVDGGTAGSGDGGDAGEADAGTDAGIDGGFDGGPPDAAVPTTTILTDAGVTIIRYEHDAGTDCDGITPLPDDFRIASASFPAQAGGCPPPMTDESGVIALGSGGQPPIGEYTIVSNDVGAGYVGSFAPGVEHDSLRGEPNGFSAAIKDGSWTFTLFGRDGAQLATAGRQLGADDTSDVSPLPSGGYALVVGDFANADYTLQSVTQAGAWQLTRPVVLDHADTGVLKIDVRASQEGNLIVEQRDYLDPPSLPNRWYTTDGRPLTDWFGGYPKVVQKTLTMLGGVVFDTIIYANGGWPDYYWFVPDPAAQPAKPPDMTVNWVIVRRASAYANWGQVCFSNGTCWRNPNQMDLLSRSGLKCASLVFDPWGTLFVGRDGTVIEQSGCSYRWYPQLLK